MSKIYFQSKVQDFNSQGFGVVRHPQGKVFFVPGVWLHEVAEFECDESDLHNPKTTFAKVKSFIETMPQRREVACEHWGFTDSTCAGCPWMIVDYSTQCEQKDKKVLEALEKSKVDLSKTQVHTIWSSETEWAYRNRVDFKTNGNALGFVSFEKTFTPIQDCLVLSKKMQKQFKLAKRKIQKLKIKTSDELLSVALDENTSIENLNVPNHISFQQGNNSQNLKMQLWLKKNLENHARDEGVLELFCGNGNFTQILSDLGFSTIVGVEGDEASVFSLKQKALPNVIAITENLYKPNSFSQIQTQISNPKILVLDPPRQGLKNATQLLKLFPSLNSIYSFSCNPLSFAKNAKEFLEAGFILKEIQPVDLFPQTPHVEVLSVFMKKDEHDG